MTRQAWQGGAVPAGGPNRIVIVSAGVGAGHDGASRELGRRLREQGFQVDLRDVLDIFPWRSGKLIRRSYRGVVRRLPWMYGGLFAMACRLPWAASATRALLRPIRGRMMRLFPPDTRAVVATFPISCQLIGPLRRSGRLAVPAVTYLTDFGVHPIWVSPGIDLHCAGHQTSRQQAQLLGAADVRVAGRVVSGRFQPGSPAAKRQARERFGLPPVGRLALLVAGSWGVGELSAAAADITATGVAAPVVVCGQNAALYRRMRRQGISHVFGWVDEMPALMHAVDVLVENAGGLTALESMACGLPVITYRAIHGHGRVNAAAMAQSNLVTWVRCRESLAAALTDAVDGPQGRRQTDAARALFQQDPAMVVAEAANSGAPQPAIGQPEW